MVRRLFTDSRAFCAFALLATASFAGSACSKKAPPAPAQPSMTTGQLPTTTREDAPNVKRPRFGEAMVYVDGAPAAVLRITELPLSVKTRTFKTNYGAAERYVLGEYLKALGVDVAKVRAVHVYGGSQIAAIDGDELRRMEKDLSFEFVGGDRGKARVLFPPGIKVNTTVDIVAAMTIYVDKEPPTWHATQRGGFLAFADGEPVSGVPYAPPEQVKGTRVYVDGKLVTMLKRKLLPNSLVVGSLDVPEVKFSLARYLESVGADAKSATAIDLVSDDDLVERVDAAAWSARAASMTFVMPSHSRGQMVVDRGASPRARISAVELYVHSTPPKRFTAPAEYVAFDQQPTESGGADEAL